MSSLRRRTSRSRLSGLVLPLVAGLLVLPLAACGTDAAEEPQTDDAAGAEEFEPVTVEHAFGATEVTERPERVVTELKALLRAPESV